MPGDRRPREITATGLEGSESRGVPIRFKSDRCRRSLWRQAQQAGWRLRDVVYRLMPLTTVPLLFWYELAMFQWVAR
jgi:hypothetical protein